MSPLVYSCLTSRDGFIRNNYQDRTKVKELALAILQELKERGIKMNTLAVTKNMRSRVNNDDDYELHEPEEHDLNQSAIRNMLLVDEFVAQHFQTCRKSSPLSEARVYCKQNRSDVYLSRVQMLILFLLHGYSIRWIAKYPYVHATWKKE